MADNIELNAGSGGATIATDDTGAGGHVQLMKLAISTDGSATLVPADGTNGIYVNVRNVNGNLTIVGPAADGAAVSGNPVRIAGSDGTNTQDISTTTGGHVHVHDGGNSLTVDGTVAVTNADLTTLAGAVSGTEMQVDVLTSALPTGAATAAKQPALGTAGTPSTDVITVQGHGSGTALPVSLASVPSHAVTNAGTFAVQVDGSALTALQLIDDAIYADDAAFTPGTSKVVAIGAMADETAADSVNEGDVGALRMTLDRLLRVLVNRESGTLYAGGTALTVKYAAVAASSSGDNEIVAAVTSKKIRVLSYVLSSAGTVNAKWQSATAGDKSGLIYMVANSGAVAGNNEDGWLETAAGEALQLNLSGAVAVGGHISYVEV